MGLQTAPFAKRQKTWLHLVLVMGIFLYLYSPFLDHLLGNEVYARPHTHIHLSLSESSSHSEFGLVGGAHEQEHHDEGVLCFLDIDALLALMLALSTVAGIYLLQHLPLGSKVPPFYILVSIIYLALIDPPPTF